MSPQVWQKGAKAQPYRRPVWRRTAPPQPKLEASVETTFLLQTMPRGTPCSIHWWSFQGARAATQTWLTFIRRRPWRQVCGGTRGFSQYWRGRMWSRPNWIAEDAEAMRPSILWNALRGRGTESLNEVTSCWIASARSGVTAALIRAESITVPRNKFFWMVDSALLAKIDP